MRELIKVDRFSKLKKLVDSTIISLFTNSDHKCILRSFPRYLCYATNNLSSQYVNIKKWQLSKQERFTARKNVSHLYCVRTEQLFDCVTNDVQQIWTCKVVQSGSYNHWYTTQQQQPVSPFRTSMECLLLRWTEPIFSSKTGIPLDNSMIDYTATIIINISACTYFKLLPRTSVQKSSWKATNIMGVRCRAARRCSR